MKLEFKNRWLRLLIEFLPVVQEIRRYRVVPARLDRPLRCRLRRQIATQLRRPEESSSA